MTRRLRAWARHAYARGLSGDYELWAAARRRDAADQEDR